MSEETFVLIKPDHVHLAKQIFAELDIHGTRTQTVEIESVPREVSEDHYSPLKESPYFEYIVEYFVNRPVTIAIYEGENIISKLVEVIGDKDPAKALEDTIRGRYSNDSLETAMAEKRHVRNVIHRSDSPKEVIREKKVWEEYLIEQP